MEVYILDDQFRRIAVIDRFESLIWTERYSEFGDFELKIHSTQQTRGLLTKGIRLAVNKSRRVMEIETTQNHQDSAGQTMLKVTGRSLESILASRSNALDSGWLSGGPIQGFATLSGLPVSVANSIFDRVCRNNTIFPVDNIPGLVTGTLYATGTIPEPDQTTSYDVKYDKYVYDSLVEFSKNWGLGFRLYKGQDDGKLYFNIYAGSDRTATQSTLPAVVFSPDLDNLTDTSLLTSIENQKNVCLVASKYGSRVVYASDATSTTAGFNRNVLFLDATNVETLPGSALDAELDKLGQAELSKYRAITALDGELPQTSKYKYEIDYFLGDLVEMRDDDGITNRMRVTEQIFVDDKEGERSYPTLALDTFITPGSWFAWDSNQVWDLVEDTKYWDTV